VEHNSYNRTLALAALFQAASLVKSIAWTGQCEPGPFRTCVTSILSLEADSIEEIYGGGGGLTHGLEVLSTQIDKSPARADMDITRYVIGLMLLERKLQGRPEMIERIRQGIESARRQTEFFTPDHENVISGLAQTYQDSISQIGPRIIVNGEQTHLSDSGNAARIRALLLAGIRAAVLWRQAGGNRWRLLFGRSAILREAHALLSAGGY
jgi:high frequency lysogenization protein